MLAASCGEQRMDVCTGRETERSQGGGRRHVGRC